MRARSMVHIGTLLTARLLLEIAGHIRWTPRAAWLKPFEKANSICSRPPASIAKLTPNAAFMREPSKKNGDP